MGGGCAPPVEDMSDSKTDRRRFLATVAMGLTSLGGCLRLSTEQTPTEGSSGGSTPTVSVSPAPSPGTPGPPDTDPPEGTERPPTTPGPGQPTQISGTWPQFQYDAANSGHRPEAVGPKSLSGELWTATFEGEFGHDSATLGEAGLYTKTNNRVALLSIDPLTGEEQWRTTVGRFAGGSSPTIADGTVYIGTSAGVVMAIAAQDGRRLWQFQTAAGQDDVGVMCSVTAQDGQLYFGDHTGVVYALSSTGEEQWRFETDGSIGRSTPAVAAGTVYVGSMDGRLYALDTLSGDTQWQRQLGDAVFASPTVVDGTVYVGSITTTDGGGPLTNPDGDDIQENRETFGTIHAVSTGDGSTQWTAEVETQVNSSVAVADGMVFGGPRDGPLYALDAQSGDRHWFFPTGYLQEASPAVADGVLYLATDRIYAIDAATGRERWRYRPSNGLDTTPVVSDGMVFAGDHDGVMYALYGPG